MAASTASMLDLIERMRRATRKAATQPGFGPDALQGPNRGNKLKRKDHPVGEDAVNGQRPYKKRIEHAGFWRKILHYNPQRYDEQGYELDDEDEDEEADQEAALKNAYGDISIEKLLMPLTAVADLETHPTLSVPYKSSALHDMTQQAEEMLQKERRGLAGLKLLLTDFRGDHKWIPSGRFYTENDTELFAIDGTRDSKDATAHGPEEIARIAEREQEAISAELLDSAAEQVPVTKDGAEHDRVHSEQPGHPEVNGATSAEDKTHADITENPVGNGNTANNTGESTNEATATSALSPGASANAPADGASGAPDSKMADAPGPAATASPTLSPKDGNADKDGRPPPRMVTRGQAHAQARTASPPPPPAEPAAPSPPHIHPLFLHPAAAQPDRGCGLPEAEAEETRRVLSALVQKQEELVHGLALLHGGLLRAHRLARTVWRWCRAEAHAGEMSDGEDWVDPEEWGLDGPLKKGQEEPEDPVEKKTRGRRAQ